jgi:hypothetical protein
MHLTGAHDHLPITIRPTIHTITCTDLADGAGLFTLRHGSRGTGAAKYEKLMCLLMVLVLPSISSGHAHLLILSIPS